ncbi:MAG: glutamine--fructose-6-phosphate transaminase (isomerizing), partial [Candidatus Woesearchaeota archaeon]
NGIIDNYQNIRQFLKHSGYKFKSQTDTEVIPNLVQYYMSEGKDFKDAAAEALRQVGGSFAVVAMHRDREYLVAARRNSPLVIGIGKEETFAASDVPAFLQHTNKVIFLEENEYCVLGNSIIFYELETDRRIRKMEHTLQMSAEQARKGSYKHYMLKEIVEQKESIRRAVEQSPYLFDKAVSMLQRAFGIFFVGCGTSYHACVSAGYLFAEKAKRHVNVTLASEFSNYENFLTDRTVMVALSQSGETADTIDAILAAKRHGVKVIAVVNVVGSTISRLSDITIMMNSGPEICVLSTKSYTAQLAILTMLSYAMVESIESGKKEVHNASEHVPMIIDSNIPKLRQLARRIKSQQSLFLIGRNLCYPSSLEGALKIKEVSYIHAEGFAGGELKHGTLALIEQGTPAIVLSTDNTRNEIISNAEEIKARGGYIIGIDSKPNEVYNYHILIPESGYSNPLLMIIPLQILAYYLAIERGCDPDRPRNLAKSVTVK